MPSIGLSRAWRRLPEPEEATPWTEAEDLAPALVVVASVVLALALIAVAALLA